MYDMVEAIEEAVLGYFCKFLQKIFAHKLSEEVLDDPFALMILLYHVDNFTPDTRRKLLMVAGAKIGEISKVRPFVSCPTTILERAVRVAIREVGKSLRAMDVIQAILVWASENSSSQLPISLLREIPTEDLSDDEVDVLRDIAYEYDLEHLADEISNLHYAIDSLPFCQRLDYESEEFAKEENATL
ncbi:unnamed protein product [Strongylus vulgaris]|uniref:BACK domain-containing protein n=1 Tax=Strongylus vulgaris TaxID=40348 RepID=A0A3P7JSI6_STRVU|nr:unnamed protein product [Strongylus vulgaris]